jgi:pyruvate carboxylase subunit B
MSDYEVEVGGAIRTPAEGWVLVVDDPAHGVGRLVSESTTVPVVVEGAGSEWHVTVRGRRVPVAVRSWRERLVAAAETAGRAHAGPVVVKATLPGLVVAVAVEAGSLVEEGATLLTIEAMKMQNEVRAPRAGTVIEVAVASGQTVATGAPLVRIE